MLSLWDAGHSGALAGVLAVVQAQAQQIASLADVVSLLCGARAAPAAEAAQPARPAAAAAPVASAGGGPATERPASGATRAASARGPSRRGGLPARVGDTSLRRSFVLSMPVARGANWFLAGGGRRMDEEEATAAAAVRIAAAAEDGTSLPVRLATDVVRLLYGGTGRREPADGGVVSASLLHAKPAVGGIGVEPRGGGVLRVLFTVASDAVADTVVRWRHELRRCVDSTAVFDVLSDREEEQHQALWPAFLAAKVAGKRAQFHRARLVVDGERIADAGHSSDALAVVLAVVQAQTQHIASLVDLVHLLVSRVPGAPMQMPHAVPHAAHSAPRAAPAAKAAQPARPAAAAAPVASAAGAPAAERPAAAGTARAASAGGPSRRGGLPARVGETSLCRSHVLSIPVAAATRLIAGRGSEGQMARDGIVRGALRDASYLGSTRHVRRLFSDCYGSEETAVAAAAVWVAAAAVDGVSLPVCLAMNLVRFVHDVSGRDRPAGGGVVSASFLNAKPAVGGIGVEPRRGGVLRVLFTVASDAMADTVVRSRRNLRDVDPSAAVFDVLSDREEAQHQALWPAFLAAKVAGKRAQFHRARLVVDASGCLHLLARWHSLWGCF
ncbi:hypothetical protein FOA52_004043 [Chlamydomonas sp. UWO 241]|nr:hypothetical protein FOA52_004043 [Chlamydomonas sp. UWO 241]